MKETLFFIIIFCVLTAVSFAQGWNMEMIGMKYDSWDNATRIAVEDDYAYLIIEEKGIAVTDISELYTPMETGFYYTSGEPKDIAVSGNYIYIAEGESGLSVVDISLPYNPQFTGRCTEIEYAHRVFIEGDFLFRFCCTYNLILKVPV